MDRTEVSARRAGLVGTGLIGASIGKALRERGWFVTGRDLDAGRVAAALDVGAIDAVGTDPGAELTFVAVPVGAVADAARAALDAGGVVTDVGSVKAPVADALPHPRFVGGHPMAGSEAHGVAGSTPEMFHGATWVLTPTATTDPDAQALVHGVVRSLGADVVTLSPEDHDRLVATVSHVPHLTAVTLMGLAARRAEQEAALLRLAAGGFRDMTRIAGGDAEIWLDICADNRDAILDVLDDLIGRLGDMRGVVDRGDVDELRARLLAAQVARRNLPTGAPPAEELAEVRVAIPDQPGELAAVTTLATELGVNVYDVEVVHAAGERRGLLSLVVASDQADSLVDALRSRGRAASTAELA
ncbi:MAG: prephenate dehydrogenase/arogenate dehydrogenase family protein [Actinobacteria bacterium]|nr:prephenate dehydrogenase/arogenate dehydrogenase family protein [Actinomycetota bacterium]